MKTFAYCSRTFTQSVRSSAGVTPFTCPPLIMEHFLPGLLEGYRFLYFKLHGIKGEPFWYGDNWLTALSAETIHVADLRSAVVFAANCHLPESPMLDALLAAGAQAVVAGGGRNFAGVTAMRGADLLGYYFRLMLQLHIPPKAALSMAKYGLRTIRRPTAPIADALAFQLFTP